MARLCLLFYSFGFCVTYAVAVDKRILVNDDSYTQQQLQAITTTIQDLQNQLTVYKNDLSAAKNEISATKSQLAAQELKLTMQENKIMQQSQTITTLERHLLDQEANITVQQTHVSQQQATLMSIERNITGVLQHNFIDEMAQAMCSADTTVNAYVYALRRDCNSGHARTCSSICSAAASKMGDPSHKHVECFDAFQIQKVHGHLADNSGQPQTDEGKPFMFVYRYLTGTGCGFQSVCGPNYCCCRAKP